MALNEQFVPCSLLSSGTPGTSNSSMRRGRLVFREYAFGIRQEGAEQCQNCP